jgi:hypothetical protein
MPTIYTHEIPFWDGTTYDNTVNPYVVSGHSIGASTIATDTRRNTDFIKSMVETYLNEYCHGITIDEVLELIRKHQPERLL